jgi:hypothetical protein
MLKLQVDYKAHTLKVVGSSPPARTIFLLTGLIKWRRGTVTTLLKEWPVTPEVAGI